jgi:hypothetical protein
MKDEDFDRYPHAESSQQVGPVLRGHTEVESQEKREDSSDGKYRQLNRAQYPASVMGKMAGNALDIKS